MNRQREKLQFLNLQSFNVAKSNRSDLKLLFTMKTLLITTNWNRQPVFSGLGTEIVTVNVLLTSNELHIHVIICLVNQTSRFHIAIHLPFL